MVYSLINKISHQFDIDKCDEVHEQWKLENIKISKNWHQMLDAVNEYEKVFGNGTSWKLKRIID